MGSLTTQHMTIRLSGKDLMINYAIDPFKSATPGIHD